MEHKDQAMREPLEDAEFYVLYDYRPDLELLGKYTYFDGCEDYEFEVEVIDCYLDQYDPDPAVTTEMARKRSTHHLSLDPGYSIANLRGIYLLENYDYPAPRHLVHNASGFRGKTPVLKPHYNTIRDLCATYFNTNSTYCGLPSRRYDTIG